MRKISRIAMLCILPFLPGRIQNQNPILQVPIESTVTEDEELPLAFLASFEAYFERQMQLAGCPGAAMAIVKNDQLIYIKGFGTRKKGKTAEELLVDPHTVFRIGSLSKGFAGLLTSKLIDEGRLSWDDHVQDYLPSFQLINNDQAGRIAVRHILSHTTGLARHAYTNLTEKGMSLNQILPEFSKVNVYGKEGEYFAYQNTAFSMIEPILEKATGDSYPSLLTNRIFRAAGMWDASCNFEELQQGENVALPHQFWGRRGRYVPIRLNKKYYNAVSAGGINASIADMSEWIQVLLGNKPGVASMQTLDAIFTPAIDLYRPRHFPRWRGMKDVSYGMGWRILDFDERTLMYHGGSVNDYRSEIAIDRENKIGICILFNAQNRFANKVIAQFFEQYNAYLQMESRSRVLALGS